MPPSKPHPDTRSAPWPQNDPKDTTTCKKTSIKSSPAKTPSRLEARVSKRRKPNALSPTQSSKSVIIDLTGEVDMPLERKRKNPTLDTTPNSKRSHPDCIPTDLSRINTSTKEHTASAPTRVLDTVYFGADSPLREKLSGSTPQYLRAAEKLQSQRKFNEVCEQQNALETKFSGISKCQDTLKDSISLLKDRIEEKATLEDVRTLVDIADLPDHNQVIPRLEECEEAIRGLQLRQDDIVVQRQGQEAIAKRIAKVEAGAEEATAHLKCISKQQSAHEVSLIACQEVLEKSIKKNNADLRNLIGDNSTESREAISQMKRDMTIYSQHSAKEASLQDFMSQTNHTLEKHSLELTDHISNAESTQEAFRQNLKTHTNDIIGLETQTSSRLDEFKDQITEAAFTVQTLKEKIDEQQRELEGKDRKLNNQEVLISGQNIEIQNLRNDVSGHNRELEKIIDRIKSLESISPQISQLQEDIRASQGVIDSSAETTQQRLSNLEKEVGTLGSDVSKFQNDDTVSNIDNPLKSPSDGPESRISDVRSLESIQKPETFLQSYKNFKKETILRVEKHTSQIKDIEGTVEMMQNEMTAFHMNVDDNTKKQLTLESKVGEVDQFNTRMDDLKTGQLELDSKVKEIIGRQEKAVEAAELKHADIGKVIWNSDNDEYYAQISGDEKLDAFVGKLRYYVECLISNYLTEKRRLAKLETKQAKDNDEIRAMVDAPHEHADIDMDSIPLSLLQEVKSKIEKLVLDHTEKQLHQKFVPVAQASLINQRLENHSQRLESHSQRIENYSQRIENHSQRIDKLESSFQKLPNVLTNPAGLPRNMWHEVLYNQSTNPSYIITSPLPQQPQQIQQPQFFRPQMMPRPALAPAQTTPPISPVQETQPQLTQQEIAERMALPSAAPHARVVWSNGMLPQRNNSLDQLRLVNVSPQQGRAVLQNGGASATGSLQRPFNLG